MKVELEHDKTVLTVDIEIAPDASELIYRGRRYVPTGDPNLWIEEHDKQRVMGQSERADEAEG